jgi:hypothetical protein
MISLYVNSTLDNSWKSDTLADKKLEIEATLSLRIIKSRSMPIPGAVPSKA